MSLLQAAPSKSYAGWVSGKKIMGQRDMVLTGRSRGLVQAIYATVSVTVKINDSPEIDLAEEEFNRQEVAFIYKTENEPLFFSPYQDEFVIFYNGDILDHDLDLAVLTERFFSRHPDVPAIIKKLGHPTTVTIDTPFFD